MFAVAFVFIVGQVWLDLKAPEFMAEITRLVQSPGSKMSAIWTQGLYMLMTAFGSLAAAVITGFVMSKIAASFSQRLRSKMYDKVDAFSSAEINKFSTSSLITRTTNDVMQVSGFMAMGLQTLVKSPILAIWAILKITGKGVEWSVATAVASGGIILLLTFLIVLVIPKFKKMQTLTDNINKVTRENLTGLPVVRAYNAENYQQAKFERANKELTDTQLFTSRGMAIMEPFMGFIMGTLTLAIYAIGAILINKAAPMTPIPGTNPIEFDDPGGRLVLFSDMMVFSSYAMQVIFAFMLIAMLFIFIPRASVSAKRINEVLDTPLSITQGSVEQSIGGKNGDIVFNNVGFKYPGAADYVLQGISFTAKQGETVAFIGSTGSGKSTLVNLIPRFYDATEGEILLDGVNVRDYRFETLRGKLGYVSQKAVLFTGTVKSNVAFGAGMTPAPGNFVRSEITDQQIRKAIEIAQGKDFVEKLEGAYDGQIARGGGNISGGQKQRLAIARAVAKNPEVYIFDDSFSALDYKTDRLLRKALKDELKTATCLIVAQRIGTIMDADKIVVLDEGKIVGQGTHRELLKSCAVYKEIAASQLSEEELKKGSAL
jgi:ATP-binding cassette subfamily B protein